MVRNQRNDVYVKLFLEDLNTYERPKDLWLSKRRLHIAHRIPIDGDTYPFIYLLFSSMLCPLCNKHDTDNNDNGRHDRHGNGNGLPNLLTL